MSTTTTKGIVPEEPLVYADLSQQFVPFEESDESVTPPITIEQNRPDEHSKNVNDELVNRSSNGDCDRNVVEYVAPEMLREVRVMDDQSIPTAQITRQFRKRSSRRRGGNGLCPPHPPEDVPVVDWSEPTEIKHIFPKTYNYVVYAQARYSSQYLNLSKWRKEFDFFFDKYKYWRDIIQKKQLTDYKEIAKAKQLVGQLRWLLDHCWEGDESKPLVPEMLWRARKEETRRCEQLLIRKEYYKRKVMVKKAIPSLSGRLNNKIHLRKYDDDHSCSLKDNTEKLPSMFQRETIKQTGIGSNVTGLSKSALSNKLYEEKEEQDDSPNFWKERDRIIKKRAHLFSLQFLVRRWADVLKQMQTPSGIVRPLCYRTFLRNRVEQYIQELVTAYEKIKDSDDFDEQTIHILLRRDVLLKEDMCENGLESLTCNWVIFESKSPKVLKKKAYRDSRESSKSTSKFPFSSTSSTLLKVRDYLDDDVKSATPATPNFKAGQMMRDSPEATSEVTKTAHLAATRDNSESMRGGSDLTNDSNAEIPRPVAIKPSNLAEHEKNRLELQEVVAVETLWAAFAKTETPKFKDDKPILDAIEAVLNACKSYRSILEVPLPKTLADLRRTARFRNIHESVAVLQALIIQRHEAKTGRRLDLTLFETPEIKRLRAQFTASLAAHNSNPAVPVRFGELTFQPSSTTRVKSSVSSSVGVKSLGSSSPGIKSLENNIKQEEYELPPKKKQRHLNEGVSESNKDELERETKTVKNGDSIEMLATNRPKRHIKAPQRFIFDDEEKEEEKKKKVMRERTKTTKGHSPKAMEKLKETSQYDKAKHEKNIDSSSFSMELSNMETIVVIPEDDSMDASDFNSWSLSADDEILLDRDLINVTAEHELKYESDGIVHDVFRYIGTWKNGSTHEVSRRVYELWTNRKIAEISEQSTTDESKSKGTENTTEQQRSIFSQVAQQKRTSSINLLRYPDDNSNLNERVTNHNSVSNIYSNDFVNRLSNTGPCSSQDITFGITSREQNEDGDCGPWRQVAFRKEASINGPIKMNKLKTQYDHLLMISEKNYVRKLCLEWMYVPEGGLFDDRVKRIRQFIQELEDILNQSDSTWRDYFNMKKYLQTLIDNVMAEFSALSGQVASTHFLHASDFAFSSSRSTVSDAERDGTDISIRPKSN